MNYREKVVSYASVLMGHAPDMDVIFDRLHEKIMFSVEDQEQLKFWTEVSGRVHRNSRVKEIEEMEHIERYNSGILEMYPAIETLINSPNVLKWISYLDPLEDEIDWLLEYQKDNYVMERPSEQQCIDATIGSLRFYNEALEEGKSMEELFKYIPLMVWSIDNLLASDQLHHSFHPFLIDSFVPVLRAHKAASLIFLDLMDNEDKYLEHERTNTIGIDRASIFNRKYEAESIDLPIPATYEDLSSDPYLCSMSATLMQLATEDIKMLPRAENVRRAWHFTPLTNLYRLRIHGELLGVYDEYVPVVRPKILKNMSDVLYTHIKTYSEENLVKSNLIVIENLIAESASTEYKQLYTFNFLEMYKIVEEHFRALLDRGLVTAKVVGENLTRLREKAKEYGIYDDPNDR